ncbi:MAG TPA: ATP-binding protein [Pyrinomonadaceae bacterium]|jgi:predicted kinase
MTILYLICGLPGSGKSTLAKKLENELPGLRLTPDEWMDRIVSDGYNEEKRSVIESIQWEIAQQALRLGIDVILESGFWSRAERDKFRDQAKKLGVSVKLYYLKVPREELIRRLERRNADLPPHSFHVKVSDLDKWSKLFEEPTPDELESGNS